MASRNVVMGLLFFPRGGSAQVVRYLTSALSDADWNVNLVSGSLGRPDEMTHAKNFFTDIPVTYLDYTDAQNTFEAGGDPLAVPVPMHPSYEDREDAPDVVFSAVPIQQSERLAEVWKAPFAAAGADRAALFHLHHLTPQFDAVARYWPDTTTVAHLHGTEMKFIDAVNDRIAVAAALGTDLASMAEWVAANPGPNRRLDQQHQQILATTRWEWWRHGEAWRERILHQAQSADHLVVVSPGEAAQASTTLGADPSRVTSVPNGVDISRFRPQPTTVAERRARFRHWLVEAPQGWDETSVPGTVAYQDADLDRLLGPDGDRTVLIYVGRFTDAKRVPLLIRAFAQASPQFDDEASLLIWGGFPEEWEGEHPVTVARELGVGGVFFSGWRGHEDLPEALALSQAMVMPSVNDSYPQSALEAMATGLPVIATQSGGFPYMINLDADRPTGWLVPPDDEQALTRVLIEAVNQPGEIARRGRHALDHARENLSWASRVRKIEGAYEAAHEVAARRRSR